jgi:predicted flavoprotein YhiN
VGHTHTTLMPSLAPVQTKQTWVADAQGLSLRNVELRVLEKGKTVFQMQGEMLFTNAGVSGPLVLAATAHMHNPNDCRFIINLKPALSDVDLDARLVRELHENANKTFKNILPHLFPQSLCPVMLNLCGIEHATPCNQITKTQRATRGGICLDEVNPKTMRSKLIKNLSFAGEILDIDGYTGGFNLQIAFSTGYSAGSFCEIINY